jgi:hypothetical protein
MTLYLLPLFPQSTERSQHMAALQHFAFTAFWRNKKNIAVALFLLLFTAGFLYIARYQGIGDQLRQVTGVQLSLNANVNRYDQYATGQKRKLAVYHNLLAQKQAYAEAQAGMLLGDRSMLAEGNLDVARIQLAGYRLGYAGTADLNIPDEFTVRQNLTLAKGLVHSNHQIQFQINTAVSYLILIMQVLGPWFFLVILLLTSDIWLDKQTHFSVMANIPVTPLQQALAKLTAGTSMSLLLIIGAFMTAGMAAGVAFGFGDWTYPVVTTAGQLTTVPFWLALILYLMLAAVLTLFTVCLALLLNSLTHNPYVTLFAGAALWCVGMLFPTASRWIWFIPTGILNLGALFTGAATTQTPLALTGLIGPVALLLGWSAILLYLFGQNERRAQR